MRSTVWKIKNSYAAKVRVQQQTRLQARKDTLRSRANEDSVTQEDAFPLFESQPPNKDPLPATPMQFRRSNFDQLKKEIRYLEDSQVMSMKYRPQTEPEEVEAYHFKTTGKEFFPSKKMAHLERFKLCLKKKGRSKRLSLLLDSHSRSNATQADYNCLDSLKVKDLNLEAHGEVALKKKETPYIVKKFYRPSTSSNPSLQQLAMRPTQIRGRKLRTSVTNRRDKQNVLICCF